MAKSSGMEYPPIVPYKDAKGSGYKAVNIQGGTAPPVPVSDRPIVPGVSGNGLESSFTNPPPFKKADGSVGSVSHPGGLEPVNPGSVKK